MISTAELRVAIETKLAQRIPGALSPAAQHIRDSQTTGIPTIDALIGGLPVGAVSEIVGNHCSGRTTLALSLLAQVTQSEQVCAWVDTSDALDPESAAANGVDLARLLWVRCGEQQKSSRSKIYAPAEGPVLSHSQRVQHGSGGSPHPRTEARGLDTAVGELLQRKSNFIRDKSIGTPGVRNLPLVFAETKHEAQGKVGRAEQVPYDRMPSRRGDSVLRQGKGYAARCAEPERKPRVTKPIYEPLPTSPPARLQQPKTGQALWTRLDQALRVADLLLQAGGFRTIVLDLASISPEFASRIPLATWFRYRAAAEQARCCFVLLTQYPCAKSSAAMILRLNSLAALPSNEDRDHHEAATLFRGLTLQVELVRHRFATVESNLRTMRKPVEGVRQLPAQQAHWSSRTSWSGTR